MTGEVSSIDRNGLDSNGDQWETHAAVACARSTSTSARTLTRVRVSCSWGLAITSRAAALMAWRVYGRMA